MTEAALLERRIQRERSARKEAERLLEEKSRELYLANRELGRMATRLQEQVDQVNAILDNMSEGVVSYLPSGRLVQFNPAAIRLFNLRHDEQPERSILDLFLSANELPRHLFPAPDDARRPTFETRAAGVEGETPVEISVASYESQGQRYFTAAIRDVSRRKLLEAQLAHARHMESIGQLAAGVAHEINTPIQFVTDNLQFLTEAFTVLLETYHSQQRTFERIVDDAEDPVRIQRAIASVECPRCEEEITFLLNEVPSALNQSLEGLQRVATIVRVLKDSTTPSVRMPEALDLNQLIRNVIHLDLPLASQLEPAESAYATATLD